MIKLIYPVVAEAGMRRNDVMNQLNQLILYVSRTMPFRSGLLAQQKQGAAGCTAKRSSFFATR
jgi:hypothetical protein